MVNITLQNIIFENIINVNDYSIVIINSNCSLISTILKNSSTGFIHAQDKSNILINYCDFSYNNLITNTEMSFLMFKTNENNGLTIIIELSNFSYIIGSNNGAV